MARPTKKTEALIRIILKSMEQVPIQKIACNYAKIHEDTLKNWLDSDDEFFLQFQQSKAIGQKVYVKELKKKDPYKVLRAADREVWADRHEITGAEGGPLTMIVKDYGKAEE